MNPLETIQRRLIAWLRRKGGLPERAPVAQHRRPDVRLDSARPAAAHEALNAIYYCTSGQSAGGEFVNWEHVAALRSFGLRAYLLYLPTPGGVKSFDPGVPVLMHHPGMVFRSADVVVVPEPWRQPIEHFANLPVRKVIHCQNPYYVFHGFSDMAAAAAMGYDTFLSCSRFTSDMLRRLGCAATLHTVRPEVPRMFCAGRQKKLQIAFMPRKRSLETVHVQGLFRSLHPELKSIPWVPIDGVSRDQCAAILAESAVFASFSHLEGLGLPPLEAMAAGCLVAGFDGGGGSEYARPDNGFWVADGDHEGFAHALAEALHAYGDQARRASLGKAAADTLDDYSGAAFRQSLNDAWQAILGQEYDEYLLGPG